MIPCLYIPLHVQRAGRMTPHQRDDDSSSSASKLPASPLRAESELHSPQRHWTLFRGMECKPSLTGQSHLSYDHELPCIRTSSFITSRMLLRLLRQCLSHLLLFYWRTHPEFSKACQVSVSSRPSARLLMVGNESNHALATILSPCLLATTRSCTFLVRIRCVCPPSL